MVSRIGSPTRR